MYVTLAESAGRILVNLLGIPDKLSLENRAVQANNVAGKTKSLINIGIIINSNITYVFLRRK